MIASMIIAAALLAPAAAPGSAEVAPIVVTGNTPKAVASKEPTVIVSGPKGEPLLCRRELPVGSRLPVRTCMTAYDWAEKNAASMRGLDQMMSHGTYP